jgi:hypothetical protein
VHIAVLYVFLLCTEMKDWERKPVRVCRCLCPLYSYFALGLVRAAESKHEQRTGVTTHNQPNLQGGTYRNLLLQTKITVPSKLSQVITILTCIREVPGSNLG